MSGSNNGRNGNGKRGNGGDRDSGPVRTLVIIGGHEDKEGEKVILKEVVRRCHGGRIVVTTVASEEPAAYFEQYDRVFSELGVDDVVELKVRNRCEAADEEKIRCLDGAAALFFTGGDQLKITSQIGDTPICKELHSIYMDGGVIAGTSAGASAMCETMLVRGTAQETHRIGDLMMAPGLGLIPGVIIDQHFAERGRMGRLLGAVALNPRILGIGIDEDTAIVVENEQTFTVYGSGGVSVLDGEGVTFSNIAEEGDGTLCIHDIKLHVLSHGETFDLRSRRPGGLSRVKAAEMALREAKADPAEPEQPEKPREMREAEREKETRRAAERS
jgi:cyanophycinase